MTDIYFCQTCKIEIGKTVTIDGLDLLQVGALLFLQMRASCPNCGRMIYWSVSDKAIEKMIREWQVNDEKTD